MCVCVCVWGGGGGGGGEEGGVAGVDPGNLNVQKSNIIFVSVYFYEPST